MFISFSFILTNFIITLKRKNLLTIYPLSVTLTSLNRSETVAVILTTNQLPNSTNTNKSKFTF